MTHEVDADALIAAGILECRGRQSTAESFCTDLAVRVLGHDLAGGAGILRVTERATWLSVGGYGSVLELIERIDGSATNTEPEFLLALRDGSQSLSETGPAGGRLIVLGIDSPFLAVLVCELQPSVLLTPSAAELIRHTAQNCLGSANPLPSSGVRRLGDHGDSFFTQRQLEVLALVAEGKSNTEIGRKLSISASLAKLEVTFLMHALGARNRLDAVVQAQRTGLLAVPVRETN